MSTDQRSDESKALKLVKKLADYGINGVGPLSPSVDLAEEYRIDQSYESADERVDALIRWEAAKNFAAGFIAGLGGIIILPVAIPAALGASWIIQARMCDAVAAIYGHDIKSDRVRTMVLLSLLGDAGKEILKEAGVRIGQKLSFALIDRIPGRVLIEINKRIGFRLLTKAGEKGVVNLTKLVPGLGGLIGGGFDASACVAVGHIAKHSFRPRGGGGGGVDSSRGPGPREGRGGRPRRASGRGAVAARRQKRVAALRDDMSAHHSAP